MAGWLWGVAFETKTRLKKQRLAHGVNGPRVAPALALAALALALARLVPASVGESMPKPPDSLLTSKDAAGFQPTAVLKGHL